MSQQTTPSALEFADSSTPNFSCALIPLAIAIFLGAFLLFQVQPLIGKFILPWFGGSPAIWNTCLLFFQALLLLGYAYAHALTTWFPPRKQAIIHCVLLVAALIVLPIIPSDRSKPHPSANPVPQILLLLTVSVGLPYFVLSTTGPLLQSWFHRLNPTRSPYRLYALSNIGSLLALLTYPFVFEPMLSRQIQAWMWSGALLVFASLCAYCAFRAKEVPAPLDTVAIADDATKSTIAKLNPLHIILWLALPACASALLLATSNKICQDVAVVPFLWILPLAIYLLTFIICFDHPRWYMRWVFSPLVIASVYAAVWLLDERIIDQRLYIQVGTFSAVLFVCCMVCHGEVTRIKPVPKHLTLFYLCVAAGGVVGGLFVAVIAPIVFKDFTEYPVAVVGCCVLATVVALVDRQSLIRRLPHGVAAATEPLANDAIVANDGRGFAGIVLDYNVPSRGWRFWVAPAALIFIWALALSCLPSFFKFLENRHINEGERVVTRSRNFYGTLKVVDGNAPGSPWHYKALMHGAIRHGSQYTADDKRERQTTYYGPESGIGMAAAIAHPQRPRRFGVVGLGTGSMASFPRTGDFIRFYEINPEVEHLARTHFTYLSDCERRCNGPDNVKVAIGDARLTMEREDPQDYDILVIDAFSGDAIPVHLLTRECVQVYLNHLADDGVLAVHVTNRHLDLRPVVFELAKSLNLKARVVYQPYGDDYTFSCQWMLLSRVGEVVDSDPVRNASDENRVINPAHLWTDDYINLFEILR